MLQSVKVSIVFMDGKKLGLSPVEKKEVKPGKHKVVAHRDDSRDVLKEVVIEPGEHESVMVDRWRR